MKGRVITLVLLAVTLLGLGLRFYPNIADWWNQSHQSRAVASYAEAVANLDEEKYRQMLARLVEETRRGRMYGEWDDYGRLNGE